MFKSKKELKQEIANLKEELKKEKQDKFLILRNREINMEMYNFLKAITMKTPKEEIELSIDEIKKAKRYKLYVEDSYLKYAKKLKIIDPNNIVKIDELE